MKHATRLFPALLMLSGSSAWACVFVALGQADCTWVDFAQCGHTCGNGTLYAATCPAGYYQAGYRHYTYSQYAPYNPGIYCCRSY